jgi:hypothetical protein
MKRRIDSLQDGVESFAFYIRSLKGQEQQFIGTTLRHTMDSFKGDLAKHLNNGILTFLSLDKYGSKIELATLMSEHCQKTMGPEQVCRVAFVFVNYDITFENGMHTAFPPVPKFRKLVMMHVFTRWDASSWKFATCGTSGRPKEGCIAREWSYRRWLPLRKGGAPCCGPWIN